MRAMLHERPGTPLRLVDLPRPQPGSGAVLIKVEACGVCGTDLHLVDGEVVDVAAVVGRRLAGRLRLQQRAHVFVAVAAGLAEHEQVVAGTGDVDGETHSLDRPPLAEYFVQRRQLVRSFEIEQGEIAAATERPRIDGFEIVHGNVSDSMVSDTGSVFLQHR